MNKKFVIVSITLGSEKREIPFVGFLKYEFLDWFRKISLEKYPVADKSYLMQELGLYCKPTQINEKTVLSLDEWLLIRGKEIFPSQINPQHVDMPFYGDGEFIK